MPPVNLLPCRLAIALLPIPLLLGACGRGAPEPAAPPPAVKVAAVSAEPLYREYRVSGTLRARRRAGVAAQTSGVIAERLVEIGHRVTAGQLLAVLRNPRLHPEQQAALAALVEARARRDQAARDLERLAELRLKDAVGEEAREQKAAELEADEAALARARAELESLSGVLAEAELRAPFAGLVTAVYREPGEYLAAGEAALTIVDPSELELPLEVPAWLAALEPGAAIEVSLVEPGGAGARLTARLDRKAVAGDDSSGLIPLVLALPGEPPLIPGLRADAWLPWHSAAPVLLAPLDAVLDATGDRAHVLRVVDGRLDRVAVTINGFSGERVAFDAPLAPGDLLAVAGHESLGDGDAVAVVAAE